MAPEQGYYGKQAQSLEYFEDETNLKFKLTLQRWEDRLKLVLTRIEGVRGRAVAAKGEIYQVVSYYFVFQGAVLTIVTKRIECKDSWAPAVLSVIACVAVLISVHDKFHDYHDMKSKLRAEEALANEMTANINMMLDNGKGFKFEMVDGKRRAPKLNEAVWSSSEPHYRLLTQFLALVSLIVFIYCFTVLCD